VRLLAFGEYIPGIEYFPWLKRFIPAGAGGFTAGAGPVVMPLHGPAQQTWAIGPLICYEDILPDFIRQVGKLHPNLLVNLTSDSWFGADTEPWEHLALAVFASIELRVGMVRAVNSGISALIDPNGRLLQKTYADDPYRRPHAADGVIVNVPRMAVEPTVYVKYGNWFPYLCMAAIVWMGIYAGRRRG
jgi:apolipoprotein N-acyltransferase